MSNGLPDTFQQQEAPFIPLHRDAFPERQDETITARDVGDAMKSDAARGILGARYDVLFEIFSGNASNNHRHVKFDPG